MSQEDKSVPLQASFIDNPHAPDVFAAGVTGFLVGNGNIHLTFESTRVNHETSPGPVNRVVIARLVLPIPAAQSLALGLYDFLKSHGLDPAPTPDKSQMQ